MSDTIKITINKAGADRLIAGLEGLAAGRPGNEPFGAMVKQWGSRIQAFEMRRFDTFGRGGGDWKPLALSTIKARQARAQGKGTKANPFLGFGGRPNGDGARSSLARDTKHGGKIVAGAGRTVTVLNDTGALRRCLTIGWTGNVYRVIPGGVEYGIGGGPTHAGGRATMGQIASYHQNGGRHLPQRIIVAPPDQETIGGMVQDALRAVGRSMAGGAS